MAFDIYDQIQYKEGASTCYTNMGGDAYYQKNYEKAIELYSKTFF